jgi:hypothetical protein
MGTASYKFRVVGCALSWLLLGFHLPVLHQVTHHGRALGWQVVAILVLLAGAALASLGALLLAPRRA